MSPIASSFCLYLTRAADLSLLRDPWCEEGWPVSVYHSWLRKARETLRAAIGSPSPVRLYFGQEFCQRLLPTVTELHQVMEAARSAGLEFTLVTPYVTDEGLERLESLFASLVSFWSGAEVVCNDWGVLLRLHESYPSLTPVAGRLLEKMKRDPRFTAQDYQQFFSEDGLRLLRDSNATSPEYQRFLQSYRVGRVEFDNVIQGSDVDFAGTPLRGSLYTPFGFVTTGRICFIGSLAAPPERQFRVNTPCRKECRQYEHFLRRNVSAMPGAVGSAGIQQVELARKGNTVFFANPDVTWATPDRGFDRLVFSPRLPL